MSEQQLKELLDQAPDLRRVAEDFMILTDASDILDTRKPPNSVVASAYLREVARSIVTQAGLPDGFADLMLKCRPPR